MTAQQLQRLLEEQKLTPRQLAIKIGLKDITVVDWLGGKKKIPSSYAQAVQKALKNKG